MGPLLLTATTSSPTSTDEVGSGYLYELLRTLGISDDTARHLQILLLRPLSIAITLLVTWLIARYGSRFIHKTVTAVRTRAEQRAEAAREAQDDLPDTPESHLALARRVETVGRIVANIWRAAVWTIGGLIILGFLGVNLTPLVAGATVIGATVGFGAQTLVKDFLSGFLLLVEDQYRIGDTLETTTATGVVEEMTLRVTRLRGADGAVWYVPNGDIRTLANYSRHAAVVTIDFTVPVDGDLRAAAEVIEREAHVACEDPAVAGMCLDSPVLLGVTSADGDGSVLEVSVRARVGTGDKVARAVRTHVNEQLYLAGQASRPAD